MEDTMIGHYRKLAAEQPLVFDEQQKVWMAHSHHICNALFVNENAAIPQFQTFGLPLARLSNGKQHEGARSAAMQWYEKIKTIDTRKLLETLIPAGKEFDFVAAVSKQLPLLRILKGLNFDQAYNTWVVTNLPKLVKIMSPNKSADDAEQIKLLLAEFFDINGGDDVSTANLLGLFIQSYDAGRGLLTNSVMQLAANTPVVDFHRMITEVLRINPPIHSTRRVAVKDIEINQQLIKSGEEIILVMAAANLDGSIFKNPDVFDPERANNNEHLSFGAGAHSCLAKYLATDMAVEVCIYLKNNYQIEIPEQEFDFEPQLNARLHRKLIVNLKKLKS